MEVSARQTVCARCRAAFLICRRCDRGQRYCSSPCATVARRDARRRSNRRYQNTRRGRLLHARRQHHFRLRRQKVTDQGSRSILRRAVLAPVLAASVLQAHKPSPASLYCHYCGVRCSEYVRLGFLRSG